MAKKSDTDWENIGDWKNGRVRSGAKALIWISLLFGIVFIAISLPGLFAIPEETGKGNHAVLLVLLFPLIGFAALALSVHSLIAWRRFGRTELVLDPVPGSLGGDFGGYLDTRIAWRPGLEMNVTLNCQHISKTGSGKNRSTRTSIVWQREGIASLSPGPQGTRCEFRFDIPAELPQSEKASSDYHQWLLQLECELPGIDFKRNFVVPVFQTGIPRRSSLRTAYIKDSAPLKQAPESILQINNTDEGLVFYYPWHRHFWMGFMMTLFGSVFVVIGYFIGRESGGLLFPVIAGGIGGIIAIAGLYVLGNTLTTTVTNQGIRIVRNIFGLRFQRKAARSEIEKLERRIGSQMQTGSSTRVYYAIDAYTLDGRRITVADTLEGSRLADFVEEKIRQALWPTRGDDADNLELVIH
ncbi:MAG: hypothetical protein PVG45_02745 [Gammaproteobacteria bacterium]|jgi:hypothetical protein